MTMSREFKTVAQNIWNNHMIHLNSLNTSVLNEKFADLDENHIYCEELLYTESICLETIMNRKTPILSNIHATFSELWWHKNIVSDIKQGNLPVVIQNTCQTEYWRNVPFS